LSRSISGGVVRSVVGGISGGVVRSVVRTVVGGVVRTIVGGISGGVVRTVVGGIVRTIVGGVVRTIVGGIARISDRCQQSLIRYLAKIVEILLLEIDENDLIYSIAITKRYWIARIKFGRL
jgi:hypothetical protein